jgi:hypothetical protein
LKCKVIKHNFERGPSNEYYEKEDFQRFPIFQPIRSNGGHPGCQARSMKKAYMSFLPWRAKN